MAFGYFVYLKGRNRSINRMWFYFTVSVGLWGWGALLDWFSLHSKRIAVGLASCFRLRSYVDSNPVCLFCLRVL